MKCYSLIPIALFLTTSLFAQVSFNQRRNFESKFTLDISGSGGTDMTSIIKEDFGASVLKLKDKYSKEFELKRKDYKANLTAGVDGANKAYKTSILNLRKKYLAYYGATFSYSTTVKPIIFPGRNTLLTRFFYTNQNDLGIGSINNSFLSVNSSTSSGTIFTELASGYFKIFRVSLGGMITKADLRQITSADIQGLSSSEIEDLINEVDSVNASKLTAQNIIGGGGNILINFSSPLLYYESKDKFFTATVTFFDRIGFAIPKVGTVQDVGLVSNQIGLQADIWLDLNGDADESRSLAFVGHASLSKFSNGSFAQDLGFKDKKSFDFLEASAAFEISSRFRIGMIWPFLLTEGVNKDQFKPQVFTNIMPF
jgi:hypothetical protein